MLLLIEQHHLNLGLSGPIFRKVARNAETSGKTRCAANPCHHRLFPWLLGLRRTPSKGPVFVSHVRGRRFESSHLHHRKPAVHKALPVFPRRGMFGLASCAANEILPQTVLLKESPGTRRARGIVVALHHITLGKPIQNLLRDSELRERGRRYGPSNTGGTLRCHTSGLASRSVQFWLCVSHQAGPR